jgi:secreted trypsin-like serine protease
MKIVVILLLTLIVGISCAKHSPRGKSGKSKSLNSTVTSRIIKGEHAFSGEFPHQVLLRFKRKSGTKFPLCGGSLIRENWILTTAYCTKK